MKSSRRNFMKTAAVSGCIGLTSLQAKAQIFPQPDRKEESDFIVVGTGFSGISMALTCLDAGASVNILEKNPEPGGSSKLSGGQMSLAISDDQAGYDAFMESFNQRIPMGRKDLAQVIANNSQKTHSWLLSHGFEMTPIKPDPENPLIAVSIFSPSMFEGSAAAVEHGVSEINRLGGKIHTNTKALQLLIDTTGKVYGVRCIDDDGLIDYVAKKAVLLGTGGFAANAELLTTFIDPAAGNLLVRGRETATGDGINLVRQVGGAVINMGGTGALMIAATDPTSRVKGQPSTAIPFSIAFNRDGKRFVDEAQGYGPFGKTAMLQREQKVGLILDSEARRLPGVVTAFNIYKNQNLEVLKAETLEELCEQVCDDPKQLLQTIKEFNEAIQEDGSADVTPKRTAYAKPIAKGPFYAFYPLQPSISFTFGGIKINDKGQVVAHDNYPIKGLYAAGECVSVLYNGYQSGSMCGNALVLGHAVAQSAWDTYA